MTTLDAFGFKPKRKGGALSISAKSYNNDSEKLAFIQPVVEMTKKNIPRKSIEYYFAQQQEEEEEEPEPPIILRKRIPIYTIFEQIEQDSIIDSFKETFTTKRKRNRDDHNYVKRQKTLVELSYALRYLKIHTNSTNLRFKMNIAQSNLFITNMTQEFLN